MAVDALNVEEGRKSRSEQGVPALLAANHISRARCSKRPSGALLRPSEALLRPAFLSIDLVVRSTSEE
jgi:hypothetical protein